MIKIKLGVLVASEGALSTLGAAKLPVKASYHLGRVYRRASDELKHYNEKKNAMVTDLGTPMLDGEGKPIARAMQIEPGSENWEKFQEGMKELTEVEVELDINTISIEQFGDKAELAPQDLAALDWLITE